MCSGGGGSPAVINMPDTRGYDRMADLQIQAIRDQSNSVANIKQQELNAALQGQQQVMQELRDYRVQRANDTAANAARMAALIGTPPPEKTAAAPVVGSERAGMVRAQGKRNLRIDRPNPTSQATGTGLNIA